MGFSLLKSLFDKFQINANNKTLKNSKISVEDNKTINQNNFYGPVTVVNTPYSKLKTNEGFEESLNSSFVNNDPNSTNKLTITRDKKDSSINQIKVLNNNKDFIISLRSLKLDEEYVEMVQNSIYLCKLGRKKIKDEKIKLSSIQKRVFNLYSSGWIKQFVEDKSLRVSHDANENFRNLMDNSSIIFVNEFMEYNSLKSQFEYALKSRKICYLHAIGKRNIRLCEKVIANSYFELTVDKCDLSTNNIKFIVKKNLY